MFKRKGGGQRLFEQCSKKLRFSCMIASLSTEKKTDQWAKHRLTLIYEEFSETVPGLLKIFQDFYMPWLFLCWDKLRSSWRPNSTNQRKRGRDLEVRLIHKYLKQVLTKPVRINDLLFVRRPSVLIIFVDHLIIFEHHWALSIICEHLIIRVTECSKVGQTKSISPSTVTALVWKALVCNVCVSSSQPELLWPLG